MAVSIKRKLFRKADNFLEKSIRVNNKRDELNFVFKYLFVLSIICALIFLTVPVSASNPLGLNSEDKPQINPEEFTGTSITNNTYNNNTYINITATVNTTQFSNDNPITINMSWLYSYFQNLFDDVYCKLTGCVITGDLELRNAAINNTNYVQFNTSYADGQNEGRLQWNNEDGTLEVGMPGGNVNLQIGQEQIFRVTNDEGTQINNGQIVYISNGTQNNVLVKLANASNTAQAYNVIGMATEDIADSQKGYVTAMGLVRDVNTSAYASGTLLFLDTVSGGYTDVSPPAPAHTVQIGHVVRQHHTEGSILVNIAIRETLAQLDDVSIINPTNGQTLYYNATSGLWYNTNSSTPNLSDYVPYTGATTNVDLNNRQLVNVNRIGIGTASPGLALDVAGQARITTTTFPPFEVIRTSAATNTAQATFRLVARTSGNMIDGFGTIFPFAIEDSTSGIQNIARISAVRDGSDNSGKLFFDTYLSGSSSTRMAINANGNVGIGTTLPDATLTVEGSTFPVIKAQRTTTSSNTVLSAMGVSLKKTNTGNPTVGFGPGFIFQGLNNVGKVNNIGAVYGILENWNDDTPNAGTGGLLFSVFNNSGLPTTAMSILSNSNVGIGTTAPNSTLHVVGNTNVTGTVYYGALQSNSPHALLHDESGYTRICMKATNGQVVYQTIQLVSGIYQSVYVADTTGVCDKVLIKSQETKTELMSVNGEPKYVETINKTYEQIWSKQKSYEVIKEIREGIQSYEPGKEYSSGEYFNYNGVAYEVLQQHTSQEDWKPNQVPSLYKVLVLHKYNEITIWKQPLGAHDSYPLGSKVTHKEKTWESIINNNVWEPGVYGWKVI